MKHIIIEDDGTISIPVALTDQDKLNVGNVLFDQECTDNDGQILFYTGIIEKDDESEDEYPPHNYKK